MRDASPIPDDLFRAQQEWHATYRALAEPGQHSTTLLRRRLLRLSTRIWWHPYWAGSRDAAAAWYALRETTR